MFFKKETPANMLYTAARKLLAISIECVACINYIYHNRVDLPSLNILAESGGTYVCALVEVPSFFSTDVIFRCFQTT